MIDCSNFPNIVWKIQDGTTCCKIKSPPFKICGERYYLKFVYNYNITGAGAYRITLKGSGIKLPCNIKVSSWCVYQGNQYFVKSVNLMDSPLNEYVVWEEVYNTVYSKFNNQYLCLDMKKFWNESFFVISFTPAIMPSTDILLKQNKKNCVLLDNSPCISSLCHDFEKLFNNHVMSDVILISGDQKFYAHRNILSTRSDVFAAMFRNDMKEARDRSVDMTDMEPSILEQLLRYMYSGNIPGLSPENVHKLYAAADKYGVEALKMKCAIFMVENTENGSTPEAFEVGASNTCDFSSKYSILSHFANIKAVLSTEEWKKLSESEPKFAHEAFIFFVNKSPS